MSQRIFVFGSNLAGIHGAGSAAHAYRNHGAVWGVGAGRRGNSYAIATKDAQLRSLRLVDIKYHVDRFIAYARAHPELAFDVVAIGCGLAGFTPAQIAPFFRDCLALPHVHLPPKFTAYLNQGVR